MRDILFSYRQKIAAERRTNDVIAMLLVCLGLVILACGVTGAGPSSYVLNLVGQIATFGMLAISLDIIWGYAGILSLGHGLFFGIGGYVVAMHMVKVGYLSTGAQPDFMVFMGWSDLPFYYAGFEFAPYALLVAICVSALVAFVIGYSAFRARVVGVYFSIITQAFVYIAMLLMFRNDTGFGGNNGMTGFSTLLSWPLAERRTVAFLAAISVLCTALLLFAMARLVTSRFGQMLVAIRDDEARLRFLGRETLWIKLGIWTLSAIVATLAGVLYVPQVGIVNPRVLAPDLSLEIAVWVAIGGRGSLSGALLGAIVISTLKFMLTAVAPDLWPFILSALVLFVVVMLSNGLSDLPGMFATKVRKMAR